MQYDLKTANYSPESSEQPRYRSGAVARMVPMPVSTLRVWEARYQVVAPPMTATGHRLYSGADVERLRLIHQLVDQGHAIGSIARLGLAELLTIAETSAPRPALAPAQRPRTALIGLGLPRRLVARALQRQHSWAALAAAEADLAALPSAARGERGTDNPPQAELLVAELPTLQPDAAKRLLALMHRLGVRQAVVTYGFGTDAAAQRLRDAGCQVRRAPLADAELLALVDNALLLLGTPAAAGAGSATPSAATARPGMLPPPRRFDDAGLAELAAASSELACECPRHVAELVAQLASFETYSAECVQAASSPASLADQQLHQHLVWVAGTARALFESALVRVAQAEAIPLPAAPALPAETLS